MPRTMMIALGAGLLAMAAMQFPDAALALNPQPEVPSKAKSELKIKTKKSKGKSKGHKHLQPGPIKR